MRSIPSTGSDFKTYISTLRKPSNSFFITEIFKTDVEQAIRKLKNSPCLDCYDMCSRMILCVIHSASYTTNALRKATGLVH